MGKRKRTNLVPEETLSNETPEVVDKLLGDLEEKSINIDKKEENIQKQSDDVENREDLKEKEYNIISKFNPKDRVKIKDNIKFDILGHRIHNGIHNYVYTVRLQRDDDMVIIECLTIVLTMKPEDIYKVEL